MVLKPLNQVLGSIDQQDSWRSQRQFRQLIACWFQVVGPAVAAHTRPIAIQRRVLQVATSSSAWSQNLAFERHRILEKLNAQLASNLIDIRFSTAQWHQGASQDQSSDRSSIWQEHPSRISDDAIPQIKTCEITQNPVEAFQKWATLMRARSQNLPLCPHCQCPTPSGELERWSACALCATKQW